MNDQFAPNLSLMKTALNTAAQCAEMNKKAGIPQTNFVTEESSEFNIAVTKMARGKDTREHMLDEAMDVISATTVLLIREGISIDEVFKHIFDKCTNAIRKNQQTGEI